MKWDLVLLCNDAALPSTDESGMYFGSVADCSNDSFGELADRAYDVIAATLEDWVDLDDVTIDRITSQRFPDLRWSDGRWSDAAGAWENALNAQLPSYLDMPVSSLCAQLADAPEQLERKWVDAARDALVTPSGMQLAHHLLNGAQALRQNLFPGTQCIGRFCNQPGIYDCMRSFGDKNRDRTHGRLLLLELTVRE